MESKPVVAPAVIFRFSGISPKSTHSSGERIRPMVVVANRIRVAAGHEQDFEERFRNRKGLIEKNPGKKLDHLPHLDTLLPEPLLVQRIAPDQVVL